MVIHGIAFDGSSTADQSVDRVSLFLGPRGSGGAHLADATLGLPNPFATPGGPHELAGWAATISIPNSPGGATLVVYAHSGVSDTESTVSVPMMIAQSSNPGAQCTSSTTAGSMVSTIHLELSNPKPGDSVLAGALVVQGVAFDPAAAPGVGVDRVSIFLDDRNAGGLFLGESVPSGDPGMHGFYQMTITLPNRFGGHTLVVVAHSKVTGEEATLSVPISIKQ
jgi:hypothetical protein